MKHRLANYALLILIIIGVVFITFCVGTSSNTLSNDKYVAVYEEYNNHSEVIEGNGTVAFMPVPCPVPEPFDYNGSERSTWQYNNINGNLKIFYGTYYFNSSPATQFTRADCGGIDDLPYTLRSNLTILSIDKNGTINASYMNRSVILKIGDTWQSPVQTTIGNQSFRVVVNRDYFSEVYRPFVVRDNTSWTVENKGMFNKSNLGIKYTPGMATVTAVPDANSDNNTTIPDYQMITNIALNNETVKGYIDSQKYYINNVNVGGTIVIDLGNATVWGDLIVGVDLANNTTTYVKYVPYDPNAPENNPVTLKNLGNGTIAYNITETEMMSPGFINPIISQAHRWSAEGMNDTQIVAEFDKKGVLYNPVTKDYAISAKPASG